MITQLQRRQKDLEDQLGEAFQLLGQLEEKQLSTRDILDGKKIREDILHLRKLSQEYLEESKKIVETIAALQSQGFQAIEKSSNTTELTKMAKEAESLQEKSEALQQKAESLEESLTVKTYQKQSKIPIYFGLAVVGLVIGLLIGFWGGKVTTSSTQVEGSNGEILCTKYGIKLDKSTQKLSVVKGATTSIGGTFSVEPPRGSFKVYVLDSSDQRFYPQEPNFSFNNTTKTWSSSVYIGEPSEQHKVVVATVGTASQDWWKFFINMEAQAEKRKSDYPSMSTPVPSDVSDCDSIGVSPKS
jgi:hypothetical protein